MVFPFSLGTVELTQVCIIEGKLANQKEQTQDPGLCRLRSWAAHKIFCNHFSGCKLSEMALASLGRVKGRRSQRNDHRNNTSSLSLTPLGKKGSRLRGQFAIAFFMPKENRRLRWRFWETVHQQQSNCGWKDIDVLALGVRYYGLCPSGLSLVLLLTKTCSFPDGNRAI